MTTTTFPNLTTARRIIGATERINGRSLTDLQRRALLLANTQWPDHDVRAAVASLSGQDVATQRPDGSPL